MSRSRSPEKRRHLGGEGEDYTASSLSNSAANRRAMDRKLGREPSGPAQNFNPQTPTQRFIPSTYSSPGSILGKDEDAIILQIHERYLLAGLEGESHPQCRLGFGPESSRRTGDYRVWLPDHQWEQESLDAWALGHELWRSDINGLDLGLLEDKLERTVREVYNKYLLVDAGTARLVLVLPSLVPHPVLETILSTLFERWRFSSITLLPAPAMSVISAGLRSALVVDIGWEETVVTCVYEYREVAVQRSRRGNKELTKNFATALKPLLSQRPDQADLRFDLDFIEEVLRRTLPGMGLQSPKNSPEQAQVTRDGAQQLTSDRGDGDDLIEWPSRSATKFIAIPKNLAQNEVERIFLTDGRDLYPDDDELSIPQLMFKALAMLSHDMRATCISRVIFTGDTTHISGLRARILQEVQLLIERTAWTMIKGQHLKSDRAGLTELAQLRASPADTKHDVLPETGKDYVEERLRKARVKQSSQSSLLPQLREVISLGPWSGASLLCHLKIRGFVEVERDRFLSHGLSGAGRSTEISVVPQPQRMSSFGIPKVNKAQDRSSWTLAGWG